MLWRVTRRWNIRNERRESHDRLIWGGGRYKRLRARRKEAQRKKTHPPWGRAPRHGVAICIRYVPVHGVIWYSHFARHFRCEKKASLSQDLEPWGVLKSSSPSAWVVVRMQIVDKAAFRVHRLCRIREKRCVKSESGTRLVWDLCRVSSD